MPYVTVSNISVFHQAHFDSFFVIFVSTDSSRIGSGTGTRTSGSAGSKAGRSRPSLVDTDDSYGVGNPKEVGKSSIEVVGYLFFIYTR
jgi:hypothetical protein